MPTLPWVRLDTDLPTNKKILLLVTLPRGREALGVYCCALAWAGANSTDGYIPDTVLPVVHGRPAHATALVTAGLFRRNGEGWHIVNWDEHQPTRRSLRKRTEASQKANCRRWHGPLCHCWKDTA